MAYSSLRDFIEKLERTGRLVRVSAPVSTVLEMTEIQTRVLAEGGPAILFENVIKEDGTPSGMPVLVNLFGTVERVAWGMNREPHELREIGETLAFLRQPEPPGGWREALDMLRRRYFEDDIYTFSTEIVIAINPYKVISEIDDIESFISGPRVH